MRLDIHTPPMWYPLVIVLIILLIFYVCKKQFLPAVGIGFGIAMVLMSGARTSIIGSAESNSLTSRVDIYIDQLPDVDTNEWKSISNNGYYISSDRDAATYLPNSLYLGKHKASGKYVWQKRPDLIPSDENTWNPPVVIEQHDEFNIINDGYLLGGSKQRGAIPLLKKLPEKEFIYVGPYTGFAQIALALAAKLNNKIATLFIQKHRPMTYQTKMAIQLGAHVYEFTGRKAALASMREAAKEYATTRKHTRLFLLGFQEQEFKDLFTKSLKSAIKDSALNKPNFSGTIWIAGGTATLANIFYKMFPKARINVVQVGKAIDWHIDFDRSDFYIAPERFFESAEILPPYDSVPEYDAKVWRFVKEHGKPGDYIWNVASTPDNNIKKYD